MTREHALKEAEELSMSMFDIAPITVIRRGDFYTYLTYDELEFLNPDSGEEIIASFFGGEVYPS